MGSYLYGEWVLIYMGDGFLSIWGMGSYLCGGWVPIYMGDGFLSIWGWVPI